jgi:hypothetical protein
MTKSHGAKNNVADLNYALIRNLTSQNEKDNGVQTWFANVNASQIVNISTQDNLRTYIAEHSLAKRNPVHKQIAKAISEVPDRFINRNSGLTITCTSCEVDDTKRLARLTNGSIINGAQTQGEIRRYFDNNGEDAVDFLVRVEIIMEPERDEIVEIAIARNTATAVKSVSQSAARGYLTELKKSVEAGLPGETIQMSETDTAGLNTQSILQWSRLLMPTQLRAATQRNMPYKQAGKCLVDFSDWAAKRDDSENSGLDELFRFTVDIAPTAVLEYRHWEVHESWNGHRLHEYGKKSEKPHGGRPIRRDKASGKVDWVAPGILFPIMSALSAFVRKKNGTWVLEKPSLFKEDELVRRAVQQYRALDREVAMMGRSEAAYDALSIYTETISSVLSDSKK